MSRLDAELAGEIGRAVDARRGDVNVAHAADEHVSITELLIAAKTVACLLADWCGVAA